MTLTPWDVYYLRTRGWQIEVHPQGVKWYPLSVRRGLRPKPREWPIGRRARLVIARLP